MKKHLVLIETTILLFGIFSALCYFESVAAIDGYITCDTLAIEGQLFDIEWNLDISGEYVKIEYYTNDEYQFTILSNGPKQGTYTWNVPIGISDELPKGIFYSPFIKITSLSDEEEYLTAMVGIGPEVQITVIRPSSDSSWGSGGNYRISWQTNLNCPDTNVKIELYKDDVYHSTIVSSTENDGVYYDYIVSTEITSDSTYQIKITNLDYVNVYGFSNYFSVRHEAVSITAPSSGDIWYIGSTYPISWMYENIDAVQIMLFHNDSLITTIDYEIPCSTGFYNWLIPSSIINWSIPRSIIELNTLDKSLFQIKLLGLHGSGHFSFDYDAIDYSEYFTIDERSITMNSSSFEEEWYWEDIKTIYWESIGAGDYVKIDLYNNEIKYQSPIDNNTLNTGNYSFTVPSEIDISATYQLKITSVDYPDVTNLSDNFMIDERSITINLPDSSDTCYLEEYCTLSWNSVNAGDYVEIKYINNTQSNIIASNISNNGSYQWKIPIEISPGNYEIQITSLSNSNIFDSMQIIVKEKSTPGFEIIIILTAIAMIMFWEKKRLG